MNGKVQRLFISGGSGGLACAIRKLFEKNGWVVEAPGREHLDMADRKAIGEWFASRDDFDLVVCCAGGSFDGLLARHTEPSWNEAMAVNLNGAAWCAKSAARKMLKNRAGHIILIGSFIADHPGGPGQVLYASSKAALKGLAKSLAIEWGPANIRVNLIYPGFLETKMTSALKTEVVERARERHVLKRFTTPAGTAAFIRFLHQEMADTSGQVFSLDSRIL